MKNGTVKPGAGGAKAIVCRARGVACPQVLRDALARRGFEVEEVETTHAAVAKAMMSSRGPTGEKVAIVLVEPQTLTRPQELVRAVGAGAPSVACWVFEAARAEGQLRGVASEDLESWSRSGNARAVVAISSAATGTSGKTEAPGPSIANEPAKASYGSSGGESGSPSLRLAGGWDETTTGAPANGPDQGAPNASHLLSDEELAMLLGDETAPEAGK